MQVDMQVNEFSDIKKAILEISEDIRKNYQLILKCDLSIWKKIEGFVEQDEKKQNERHKELEALFCGDNRKLNQARIFFRQKKYADVVELLGKIKYPEQMSAAQKRMHEIAKNRARSRDCRPRKKPHFLRWLFGRFQD